MKHCSHVYHLYSGLPEKKTRPQFADKGFLTMWTLKRFFLAVDPLILKGYISTTIAVSLVTL